MENMFEELNGKVEKIMFVWINTVFFKIKISSLLPLFLWTLAYYRQIQLKFHAYNNEDNKR